MSVQYQLNLKEFDIKKDDAIYAKFSYHATNGVGDLIVNNNSLPFSELRVIDSSGVMRTNINGVWHDGQVWANVNGVWKEATDVFVNTNGIWKESI